MNYQIDTDGAWLNGARMVLSPNCDARPSDADIELLVIHGISLPPKEYGGGFIDRFFTNTLDSSYLELPDLKIPSTLYKRDVSSLFSS